MTDPNCTECDGEGVVEYGGIKHSYFGDTNDDGCETRTCPKCNNGDDYDDDDRAYDAWKDDQLTGDIEE